MQINAAMAKLLKDPVILERLNKQGIEPRALSNPDFGKLLVADCVRMAAVVKAFWRQDRLRLAQRKG